MRRFLVALAGLIAFYSGPALDDVAVSAAPVQWKISDGGNGHFYEAVYVPTGIDWYTAQANAVQAGGYLASIASAQENQFVFSLVDSSEFWTPYIEDYMGPWLGGLQLSGSIEPAGGWLWVTNEPWLYANWDALTSEPNNTGGNEDRIHFHARSAAMRSPAWNDLPGDPSLTYFGPVTITGYVVEYGPAATIILRNASHSTIITGGTAILGATVTNAGAQSAGDLNYTLTAAVKTGSATLGSTVPGSGSLAPGVSAANTVSATSTSLGVTAIDFTAIDPQACNSPQTISARLTVLDHAAAAFADGSTVLNYDFGDVATGPGTRSLPFTIRNLPAAYRARMDLDSITELSDPSRVFSTSAVPFVSLAAGATGNSFDVFLNTSSQGHFSGRYQFLLSDENGLSGSLSGQALMLNVTANVVPEPSTLALLAAGVLGLLVCARRRVSVKHFVALSSIAVTAVLANADLQPTLAAPVMYRLTDLGACTATNDAAQCITESGKVGLQQGVRAYVWENDIRTPPEGVPNSNSQMRINELRHIAGADGLRAYLWHDGVTTPLGTFENHYTFSSGINDRDQVVGTSYRRTMNCYRGFLWQNGAMIDIGGFLPTGETLPDDINNAGLIVGSSATASYEQPFLYENGTMTQLPILPGYVRGAADAISPNGNIAGTCRKDYYFDCQATAWIGGRTYALGTLGQSASRALDVNDMGQVVGSVGQNDSSPVAAFLWQDGTMYDLNTLVLDGSGYVVRQAYAINNAGQIVGTARYNNQTRAVLLTPVPEPSTFVLLGLGALGLLACAWRQRRRAE